MPPCEAAKGWVGMQLGEDFPMSHIGHDNKLVPDFHGSLCISEFLVQSKKLLSGKKMDLEMQWRELVYGTGVVNSDVCRK